MNWRKRPLYSLCVIFLAVAALAGAGWLLFRSVDHSYSYIPDEGDIVNPRTKASAMRALKSGEDERRVTEEMIRFGRKAFYSETFGNEVFFTDILGIVDGAFTLPNLAEAILKLKGGSTTNLRVEAAKTVTVGDRTIRKGELIDTGLDVAKGSFLPLGIKLKVAEGRAKVGIGCIMCHAVVDQKSGKVIEGVPNPDINAGLLLALGTNSAAFFTHTNIDAEKLKGFQAYKDGLKNTVTQTNGTRAPLPDPDRLEEAVDAELAKWPRGYVDTMIDMKNNPVQIMDAFTLGDHPYSWSGLSSYGPMQGLGPLSGIPNGQNMDSLSQSELSGPIFKIEKEVYLGTLLQRAANPKYRYSSKDGIKPSAFFAKVDPTPGAAGVNQLVPTPTFPKSSFVSLVGHISSVPGYKIAEHNLAMAAYQHSLRPPRLPIRVDRKVAAEGKAVFNKANCISCHAGPYFTNNHVIASEKIGTNPSRGSAMKGTAEFFAPSLIYDFDTDVPLPKKPKLIELKSVLSKEEQKLSVGHLGNGGYKVPSLIGLYWSAPYLHDGGVAVGRNGGELGISGTLYRGIMPDPANSLRALVDRDLRRNVVEANRKDSKLRDIQIEGVGHEYWVDEQAGFTKEQQEALIRYLLTIKNPN